MTRLSTSRHLRWAVPVVAATTVAGAVAFTAASANAAPEDLTPRSAAELLTDLASPTTDALSGTVVQTSRLGLPEIPGVAAGGTGPMSLTSGSNTLRVWVAGPDQARVALLGELAEYDVVRSGGDVWTYSNTQDEAVHYVLPTEPDGGAAPQAPSGLPSTPAEAADAVIAAIDPTTQIGVDEDVTVAGRPARQLVLSPDAAAPGAGSSLVGSVRLAVDAETSVPLRVQVFAAADAGSPAFEVGFTDVTFEAPDPSVFAFTPPPGAAVREATVPAGAGRPDPGAAPPAAGTPEVVGEGWTSVLVATGLNATALAGAQPELLDQLTTRVPEGRLLTTALVSVLLTDDGRVLVGAVTPETLRAAA